MYLFQMLKYISCHVSCKINGAMLISMPIQATQLDLKVLVHSFKWIFSANSYEVYKYAMLLGQWT